MTRQTPGSKLKEQGNRKPVKGQSTGGLEKGRGRSSGEMQSASGLNGTLNNMPTQRDNFHEFLRKVAPLMQSPPTYRSLEFACVAAKHRSEWILISGKAVLRPWTCAAEAQIVPVVKLPEIVALQGFRPADRVNKLVDDLRDSWVIKDREGISVRLTAKGARDFKWRPPKVIKKVNWSLGGINVPGDTWARKFALDGDGPGPSSFLSKSTFEKIDNQLRLSKPGYSGLDGLCGNLALPVPRSNLPSSFQLSAQLPAKIFAVNYDPSKVVLKIIVDCEGFPKLAVEWFPQHDFQWVQGLSSHPPEAKFVSIPLQWSSTVAKLTLYFGELPAEVSTVDLSPVYFTRGFDRYIYLTAVQQDPEDDEDIAVHRKIQELVKREAGSALAGNHWHSNPTPAMAAFVAVVKPNAALHIKEILVALDENHIPLPATAGYDRFRLWTEAYRLGGKTLQARIRTRVSKAKKY